MIIADQASVRHLDIHYIGNKVKGQELGLSSAGIGLQSSVAEELCRIYLSRFRDDFLKYRFQHSTDLGSNVVYTLAKGIFDNPGEFHRLSQEIATVLFDQTNHPNIKEGELHVCLFEDVAVGDMVCDALGLFKVDSKSTVIKVEPTNDSYSVSLEQGIYTNDLDKGCLIVNTDSETGYEVYILDALKKAGNEAQYWRDGFLGVVPCSNGFTRTREFMQMASEFISDKLPELVEAEAPERASWLNRSSEYLKTADSVNMEEYSKSVFADDEIAENFMDYSRDYQQSHGVEIEDEFQVEPSALKKYAKFFRSVIKLDKNFHVYVHGNGDLLEKGFDPGRGKNFYKLYFDEES